MKHKFLSHLNLIGIGLFLLLLTMAPVIISAQSIGSIGDPGCDPFDEACPIDGGLSLLIAAGIGLGARKAYQRRKTAEPS